MSRGPMHRMAAGMLILACLLVIAGSRAGFTQTAGGDAGESSEKTLSPEEKARLKKLDDGPKKIDVSTYPSEQQAAYPLFTKKCAKCHSIGRPINTDFVLPSQWERYVKRMTFKPNSKINEADGKSIYHFLVYDSSVRKAAKLRERLATLSPEERQAEMVKLGAINPAFKAE